MSSFFDMFWDAISSHLTEIIVGVVIAIIIAIPTILKGVVVNFCNKYFRFKKSIDYKKMIKIPAGDFLYGEDSITKNLPDFYIMKYPVTVVWYRQFCKATKREMPATPKTPPDWVWKDTNPMVYITWHDASEFAVWAGLSLPTDEEWEKAARGEDGREYPWGNKWDTSKLQCSKMRFGDAISTVTVGSFPDGDSPYGIKDMSGNVWEWCENWYSEEKTTRVLRGGSWYYIEETHFTTHLRYSLEPDRIFPGVGFRCVRRLPKVLSDDADVSNS